MRGRVKNMNLVAEAANPVGLTIYLIGMILITGALVWANYTDHQRDKRRQVRGGSTRPMMAERDSTKSALLDGAS
jgi:hypothetical protein